MLKALIFDVDGTLADTEDAHLRAFNQAFTLCGLGFHWTKTQYCKLLEISGGKERLHYFLNQLDPTLANSQEGTDLINQIHARKTQCYTQILNEGHVPLRSGVVELLEFGRKNNLQMAIATTTTPSNIEVLLSHGLGKDWKSYFAVIEDAETAPRKKPDPQVYRQAIQRLALTPEHCIAFEDSANGLMAAQCADLRVVITPTAYTLGQDFSAAWRVLPDLTDVTTLLAQCLKKNHFDYL